MEVYWVVTQTRDDEGDEMMSFDRTYKGRFTAEQYDRWQTSTVTIDGKPAVIAGRFLDFPVVVAMDNSARAEFAPATIERVISNGGGFKS